MKTPKEIKKLSKAYWAKQPYNKDAFTDGYNRAIKDMDANIDYEDFFMWLRYNHFLKVDNGWVKMTNNSQDWPLDFATVTWDQLITKYKE